ncbi:MAG TPA: hypothetical protein DHW42_00015 [Candidatus Marinimicrobia bacterium]|nr:hypothetical protein [Candidatus Neomarinimicrobiota bacterium]
MLVPLINYKLKQVNIKENVLKKILSIVPALIIFLSLPVFSQTGNAEFRATWVITWNYSSSSFSVETSQQRIRDVLDNHVKANMNAVLFQVRQSGTAYYQSSFEPWGSYSPQYTDYDPLTFAIEEAHKRGMEVHAWFNCFAAASTAPGSPAADHPEWVCRDQAGTPMTESRALSPGLKSVRDYTVDVAMEIVNNYDIDGLHLDYVRWNEYSNSKKSKSYAASIDETRMLDGFITEEQIEDLIENKGGRYLYDVEHPYSTTPPDSIPGVSFSSWENYWRWSVTEFVRTLHDSIQSVKPWVRLSAATLGKYRWSGWQGYGTVYHDAALWFNEGYVDQLTPMHYHWTTASGFLDMLAAGDPESWDYYIQPGIAAGRLFSVGPGSYILLDNKIWYRHKEIIQACRSVNWVDGFQFFSYGSWNSAQYWEEAGATIFDQKTKIRSSRQNPSLVPPAINLVKSDTLKYEITVTPYQSVTENQWFVIYRSEDAAIDLSSDEIVDIHFGDNAYTFIDSFPGTQNFNGKYHYAATGLDRFWSESPISNLFVSDSIPSYAPVVLSSTPVNDSTVPVNTPIEFIFSKSIDTTGFSANITITPAIPLSGFKWTDNNRSVEFLTSGSLVFDTQYIITLNATLSDVNDVQLDGNADGVPGDSYTISFRTYDVDVSGPVMLASYPDVSTEKFDLDDGITVEFDELLDPNSVNSGTISMLSYGNPVTIEPVLTTHGKHTFLNIRSYSQLVSDAVNLITLGTGITDTLGNPLVSEYYIDFITHNYYYSTKNVFDNFNQNNGWESPTYSGSTDGVVAGNCAFGITGDNYLPGSEFNDDDKRSAYLRYQWDNDTTVTDYLLREYLAGGATRNVIFDTTSILQCYIYGDGSHTLFRFAVDDKYPAEATENHEVSPWIEIDWVGWRLVEWDLGSGINGQWLGDGSLDGNLRMDSFQMTKTENSAWTGKIYFDNLRLVKRSSGQAPPNTAPVIEDLPDTSVTAGKYVKIYPTWTDPDAADVHQIICQSDTSGVYFYIKGHTSGSTVYVKTLEEYAGTSLVTIIVKDYGIGELSDTTQFTLTVYPAVSIDNDLIPVRFSLSQNYPNPFNPTTTIRFSLDRGDHTHLIIYDLLGRKITEILNRHLNTGNYEIVFDASDLPSGQYFYQLISGQKVITKKMMLLK